MQFAIAIACKFTLTATGIELIDFFSKYYVFFLAGHFGRDIWFALAHSAREQKLASVVGLAIWAVANGLVVWFGYDEIVPVAIIMGVLGFMAVIDFMGILTEFCSWPGAGKGLPLSWPPFPADLSGILPSHGRDAHSGAENSVMVIPGFRL